jgi:amino acid adenylation domain-containing protein
VFQLQHSAEPIELPAVSISSLRTAPALAKFDLNITLAEDAQGLSGVLEYNADLFAGQSIGRLLGHWQTLLAGLVADPDASIERLPLLTAAQRHQQLVIWNRTRCDYGAARPVHLLFAEQAERTPERVAVVCEDGHLTYHMLNQRAEQLAGALRAQGVADEQLVALLDERGSALLIAILAVWQAGGAYLALDPQDPPARLRQLLTSSRSPFVLTGARFAPLLGEVISTLPAETAPRILLRTAPAGPQAASALPVPGQLLQLAYVMYTSGSTGQPKGALLEQRGMLNHLYAKIRGLALRACDRVAHTASQCFDISVWQFLAPLLVGGLVHIFADSVVRDPGGQLAAFEEAGITVFESAPSLLAVMLSAVEDEGARRPALAAVHGHICSGEALPPDLCRRWLACYPHIPIVNTYGATECSDDVTSYRVSGPAAVSALRTPVGRPLGNMRQYVLDRHLQPVPPGVAGEVYLGGPGVGRGYLGDPWRTAEVFLADPFSDEPGARFYRTGDLARLLPDGTLDFLGRLDHQVKIRGFRIELEEISMALREHPLVREAVVVTHREEATHEMQLVAYIVALGPQVPAAGELRRFLKARLPEYMLPTFWLTLDALPLNANGKIERRALPAPRTARASEEACVAPRTPLEERLARVWGETLGLARIGVFENFFEIGGHSLLATRLLSRLRTTFGVECSLRMIFVAPTISAQAQAMARLLAEQVDSALLSALEELPPDEATSASMPGGERL